MADMDTRFEGMKKIPQQPAARLLAQTNIRLETPLSGPASASVPAVLAELSQAGALVDMLKLMAVSLPPRECAWWACLAARDVIGPEAEPTPALSAAEAWVFRPGEDTRQAAKVALDAADIGDPTSDCASIAVFADGTLGPGDLNVHDAPPGACSAMALGMNVSAMQAVGGDIMAAAQVMLDRALDIARGGSGRIAATGATNDGGGA